MLRDALGFALWDRPNCVVGVLRGVAQTVHISLCSRDLVLVCTESITSGESATSRRLSALTGQLGSLLYMNLCVCVCVSVQQYPVTYCKHTTTVSLLLSTTMPWVAVCCSVLQCVAVCCSVLQCVAVRRGLLLGNVYHVS